MLLNIVTYPDPRLREKSVAVTEFGPELKKLVADMAETMAWANGIGLAAIQVGVGKRLLVIDIGELNADERYIEGGEEGERRLSERKKTSKLEVFVNPIIVKGEGENDYEEGCLSVPGVYANVTRKKKLWVRYQDLTGKIHEMETEGLKSIVIQHELDHLDGVVFPDRLGPMQRMMVLDKYKKLQTVPLKEKDKNKV